MYFLRIAVIFVYIAIAHVSFAEEANEAMFGLRWGMTPSELNALGVVLNQEKGELNLDIYSTNSLPKPLSETEKYILVFSDGKLVKLNAFGENITNDPYGTKGKERFDLLKKSLEEKYGKPSKSHQSSGIKLYKERDEFYQCLAYKGCGLWLALFDTPTKKIGLELNGIRRGTGYVEVTAEAIPGWSEALEKMKSLQSRSDSEAL